MRGEPEPGRIWQVGIAHPLVRDARCAVLSLGDGAVATSGTAERGAHVLDPHTGRAALDLASVTVLGPDLATADAFATGALARGHVWSTPGLAAASGAIEGCRHSRLQAGVRSNDS